MITQANPYAIEYYYDTHPLPGEDEIMSNHSAHTRLMLYLVSVLAWYYRAQNWFIIPELRLHATQDVMDNHITPDVAVFLGVVDDGKDVGSWFVHPPDNPGPTVVFEIASDSTWEVDILEKPAKYGALGIPEYYAYDPYRPQVWKPRGRRLRGWQLLDGQMVEIAPEADGRLWSAALDSWLVPDGPLLRLVDRTGVRRMSEREAQAEAERQIWIAKRQTRDAERVVADVEQRVRAAEQRAEAERQARVAAERCAAAAQRRTPKVGRRAKTEAAMRRAALDALQAKPAPDTL